MRLLSMISEGHRRAGIMIGNEVLDITDFAEILEEKGEWIEAGAGPEYHHLEGLYQDVLDAFHCGSQCRLSIRSRLAGDPLLADECRERKALVPLDRVKLGSPVAAPSKILAVGLNYREHAAETGAQLPDSPLIFSKCTTALIATGDPIRLPRISEKIDYEAELAVVIGLEARSVKAANAFDYVAGYTIMNDVTARDIQRRERQWVRAKGLDTFAPCGPWLVTPEEVGDPHLLNIELRLNGEVRQTSNTSNLIFKIPELIEFASQDLTLRPGDIISTGTPPGVGFAREPPSFLKSGDKIEITIEKIGTLSNQVIGPDMD
jgi:2-keto-4-pentenoate hydratase/2-oxohepta-3-ene-1,7-dioic acid hydratase in catechol pathway